jgi:hypothetical protein
MMIHQLDRLPVARGTVDRDVRRIIVSGKMIMKGTGMVTEVLGIRRFHQAGMSNAVKFENLRIMMRRRGGQDPSRAIGTIATRIQIIQKIPNLEVARVVQAVEKRLMIAATHLRPMNGEIPDIMTITEGPRLLESITPKMHMVL